MNRYLATIAARSAQEGSQSLIPTTSTPAVFDEGSTVAAKDNFQQNESVQQNLAPNQHNQIEGVGATVINRSKENPLVGKSSSISYFSQYTERLSNLETKNTFQDNLLETAGVKLEEPVNLNTNEGAYSTKTGLNILPQKKGRKKQTVYRTTADSVTLNDLEGTRIDQIQFLAPSIEQTQKLYKLQPNISKIERINPILSGNENTRPVPNNKKTATPTLVIGKITVEILPPIAAVPPKISTKVLPPTSTPSQSKSNKLIFGLGQM